MATRINFWELPIEDAQPDDTVPAYRGRGQVARVRFPEGGGGDGSVTSVGVSVPSGFEVANSPITSSGTIAIAFAAGYGLPTTAAMGQWSTAFGWGDHAQAGYASASAVALALAEKVDKEAGKGLSTEDYTTGEKTKLANVQAGATANASDSYLLNRANHTGTQAIGTIVNLQSALDTKVSTSDVRLSDAREWSASTVTQATAEAGASTARFAWTAQRVRQAVAAYTYDKATIDDMTGGGPAPAETYPDHGVLTTENLNDVRAAGVYGQPSTPNATLARNYPDTIAGVLEVLVLNADTTPYPIVTQRYTTNEGDQRIFIRRGGAQGGWNAWKQIAGPEIGTNAQGNKHISTSPPSGTSPGDIWYQVES